MRADYRLITTLPTVFTVDGDLAGDGVPLLAQGLWPHVLTGPPDTLVDLALASTIDADGLDLLVAVQAYTVHRGVPLRIVNAAPRVLRVLRSAGVSALPARGARAEFATMATTSTSRRNAAVAMA